jgi:hypothetical protein
MIDMDMKPIVRAKAKRVSWPSISAALLIMVGSVALALLLVVVSLRCADAYELISMTKWPACVAPPSIAEVTSNVRCTAPSLLYDLFSLNR